MYDVGRDIMWKISLYYTNIDNADLQLASGFYDEDDEGQHIDGIIYGSSKSDERNIVLFCNQKESENYLDSNVKIEEYGSTRVWMPKKK